MRIVLAGLRHGPRYAPAIVELQHIATFTVIYLIKSDMFL